jgi:adenosylhomocysteine nucleosidase
MLGRAGEGAQRAARGLDRLLASCDAELVIGAGVAAGLSLDLARGDVVVAREVRDEAGPVPPPDPRWTERALALGAKGAVLVASRGILATRGAKAEALAAVGAGTTTAADMESAAWARTAARRGVPYIILRAISDTADEELPLWLGSCLDAEGGLRRARVIGRAMVRPAAVLVLLRLHYGVRRGVQRLADFLERLLGPGLESATP